MPESETAVAARVVAWLKAQQWGVYQEVSAGYSYPTADIVATQGRLLWVVETKRGLGLPVIAQASWWQRYAHFASVAVPPTSRTRAFTEFERRVLRWAGIGLLSVGSTVVHQDIAPALNRNAHADQLRKMLNEAQRDLTPAGGQGGYWTPFRQTCRAIRDVVVASPGITMRDAIAKAGHHYTTDSTARSCMANWIRRGKVDGVRAIVEGRAIRLWPAEAAEAAS